MSKESPQDEQKALLANLIMMLSSSAMQQLGQVPNPMTGKTETNLEGAQVMIDMISMIEAKTQGNLDADEQNLLQDTRSSLQMAYVQAKSAQPTAQKDDEQKAGEQKTPETEGEKQEAAPIETGGSERHDESHQPKFHKSYGA